MDRMTASRRTQRWWAPLFGARERTAATALVLLFVMGTVQAGPSPGALRPCLLTTASTNEVRLHGPVRADEFVRPAARRPLERVQVMPCRRSLVDAELPPVRAPDRS